MATDSAAWNDSDDNDDFINDQASLKMCYVRFNFSLKNGLNTILSNHRIGVVTLICLLIHLAASIATTLTLGNRYSTLKISNAKDAALDTGKWFRDQLENSINPLFSLAEFVKEMEIFQDLPFLIGKGGEPGSAPYRNDTIVTHRNVSGICNNTTKMAEFSRIAKTIKADARMNGVLVALNIAPASVVCIAYPMLNAEDFTPPLYLNNSGSIGHDLLKDPKRRAAASETLPSHTIVAAGPRSLVQCPGCPPAVRTAFIAMMTVNMPPEMGYNITADDGTSYSAFGFVSAIINWERLLDQSRIFERFEGRGMQFELSKTDRNFNLTTNQYESKVRIILLVCATSHQQYNTDRFEAIV
jgi:hypothetical protein